MRCVVTGAAGFVGSSIVDELLSLGHEVIGIDCFIDYYPREIKVRNTNVAQQNPRYRFLEENLLSADLVQIFSGVDWIFHQAAQAGVRASWGGSFSIYTDNNILATQRVLEACRDPKVSSTLKKVVYASSSSVYGSAEALPTSEEILPAPVSPYGVSKLAAEHLMTLYSKEFSVPTTSLRYFTVYGPRQRPDMAFGRLLRAGILDEQFVLNGTGEQSRDFTYIEDIVRANLLAAERGISGRVYNIGGGSRVTMNQVIELIGEILGAPLRIVREARAAGDALHTGADTSLANRELGYSPTISLREGLTRHAAWLREQLPREQLG